MAFDPLIDPTWYVIPLNPQPWAIGDVGVGRRNGGVYAYIGPNIQLQTYQQGVREAIVDGLLVDYEVKITFYFWHKIESYQGENRKVTKNQVDATNMQKATEDALQGILMFNDRQVRSVRSEIVEQSETCEPMVVIKFEKYWGFDIDEIPKSIWDEIKMVDSPPPPDDNVWPPRS